MSELKKCPRCEQELDVSKFSKNSSKKSGLASHCKQCSFFYRRQSYQNNIDKYRNDVKERKGRYKKAAKEYVDTIRVSCKICGESEKSCLDFHHDDPSQKENSISALVAGGFSIEKIALEISKCTVVCSNCHRKIHAGVIKL